MHKPLKLQVTLAVLLATLGLSTTSVLAVPVVSATSAWTSTETSYFTTATPTQLGKPGAVVWESNNLSLSYDRQLVAGSGYTWAQSLAGLASPETVTPSLWANSVMPSNAMGISFRFSHSGYFADAQVSMGYYMPNLPTGIGVNEDRQANRTSTQGWTKGQAGSQELVVDSSNPAEDYVQFFFDSEQLSNRDGLLHIYFTSRGITSSFDAYPNFEGSALFGDVRWLLGDQVPTVVSAVSEPSELLLLTAGLAALTVALRRRSSRLLEPVRNVPQ